MIDSSSGAGRFKPLQKPTVTPEQVQQQFRDVSKLYEKHFLREMTKAMRSTVHESGFIQQNQAEKIFREQLDQEYVEKWGDRGGVGFADMIYKQLVEKYGPMMGLSQPLPKPHGPLPMDKTQAPPPVETQKDKTLIHFKGQGNFTSPWAGRLAQKIQLAPEQWALTIEHGQHDLKSQLSLTGFLKDLSVGQEVEAGENLGRLSPDVGLLTWAISPLKSRAS